MNEFKLSPLEVIKKNYRYDTSYQRDEAWTKKNQSLLIDSLMNDYYVPPILIANNEVIDGKQRLISLLKFVNNEIVWEDKKNLNVKKKKYSEFSDWEKARFNIVKMGVVDLGTMERKDVLETFLELTMEA